MKPLVLYHANCADGYGAAFAAWLILQDTADYIPCQYGADSFNNALVAAKSIENRTIYILDFSFPKADMEYLFREAAHVVWLDHHKTAFEAWNYGTDRIRNRIDMEIKRPRLLLRPHHIILDNKKSGAYLAWEHFHPSAPVPLMIQHIDDYDRWQFKLENTKEYNKAIWSYAPWSFDMWQQFILLQDHLHLYHQGRAILRAHNQNVQAVVKGATRPCTIPDIGAGLAANCPSHLTSDVGHELANQSGTYGLCWTINKDGKCLCSLRSNAPYDVSAIARAFGGGGHAQAAGFEIPIETLLSWIK